MNRVKIKKGDRYGKLTIIKEILAVNGRRRVLCKCDCGKNKEVDLYIIRSGRSKSCGCARTFVKGESHLNFITGDCYIGKNKLYRTYRAILQRCNNKNDSVYRHYGGRGIKCLWKTYLEFKEDMEESFLKHLKEHGGRNTSIDRIDVDGHYFKENCRWATQKEQQNNRRRFAGVYLNGKKVRISELKKQYIHNPKLDTETIKLRIKKGWKIERALLAPAKGAVKSQELPTKNLHRLTNRELEILKIRCSGRTYDVIGEKYGISRERVRQILKAIDKKLKRP